MFFFDIETTGLPLKDKTSKDKYFPPENLEAYEPSRIVTISWIIYDDNGNLIKKEYYIVQPDGFFSHPKALEVHKITHEYAIKNGISIKEIFKKMKTDLINENSEDKVIFCGDVSDEMFASYRGFMSAPDDESLIQSNVEMLKNIRFYDVLRSDKSISGAGLEARVPFGDLNFLQFVMSLPAKYKKFNNEHMEKFYLRANSFKGFMPCE